MTTGELVRTESVVRPVRWRLAALRRAPIVPLGLIILLVLTALLANVLTPYSPVNISLPDRLRPPFWEQGGSLAHPLGTDPMGRDLLTRLIYGARISLLVGFLGLLVGGGVGAALGLIAGYAGGRLDALLMRITDTTLSFPIILFAILLVVILGSSLLTVVFAVALVLWARFARVIRGEGLEYSGARLRGAGPHRWELVSTDHYGAPLPQCPQHAAGASLPADRLGDHRGGLVELSGCRCTASNTHLGLDDRRRPGLYRQRLVGLVLSRPGHSGDRTRFQSVRRLAAGCP